MKHTGWFYFIAICLVDGFGSILVIARASLIEDISEDESHRLCMQRWDMVLGIIEFIVKAGGFALYDAENMSALRIYILGLSAFSVITTLSASLTLQSLLMRNHLMMRERKDTPPLHLSRKKHSDHDSENEANEFVSMKTIDRKCVVSLFQTFRSFLQCKDFYNFVGCSVVDEAHRTFNDQFRTSHCGHFPRCWDK